MNSLQNPHVVNFIDVYEGSRETVIVNEYLTGGELFEKVSDDDFSLTELECVEFIYQICDGISYCHSQVNTVCVSQILITL